MAAPDDNDAPAPAGDDRIAERPEPDKLVRAVARARVAERLFATKETVRIGRYHLLEMVGAGGMGVVWGAWDPELERRVAIKLLTATRASARERILAEGQALAKLSHPNVVPVFDVGVLDEQVYLVMEWVRGKNLRAWCADKKHQVRDIVAMYRGAGAGLLAAHEAGLVHRDFKPDNAVVGDDGRVRVLDFGLARSEIVGDTSGTDSLTRGAGTPRYMAPEQTAGGELTAAADQYAFGVSLREAVAGQGEVPAWITAIVTRATARSPAERFASMSDLLAALARDPRTVWRRRLLAGAALLLVGGAFAAGTMRSGDRVERCGGGRAEIASVWSDAQQAPLVAHLRGLGAYGEVVAAQIAPELDAYTNRWVDAQHAACVASDAGELTRTRYEQNLGCLARARAGLSAAHDVLSRADLARLPDALVAARSLPDPQRCRLEAETSTVPPPSMMLAPRVAELANDVARARVLALALDPRAVAAAQAVETSAAGLGYDPLTARATLAHGAALMWQRDPGAIEVLDRAQGIAFASGDLHAGVESIARELFAIATTSSKLPSFADTTIAATGFAENIAKGLGPTGAFERALLLNNLGSLRMSKGDRVGARAYFDAALGERPPVTGPTYELASIPGNRALVEDDPTRRAAFFAQQQAELVALVGPDHPRTLDAMVAAAAFASDPAVARRALRDVCLRLKQLHPHLTSRLGPLAYDLLWLAYDDGDLDAAREASRWLGEDDDGERGRAYLHLDELPAEAVVLGRKQADDFLATGKSWARWRAVDALLLVALGERRLDHPDRARAAVAEALELTTKLELFANTLHFRQRLSRLRALQAQ